MFCWACLLQVQRLPLNGGRFFQVWRNSRETRSTPEDRYPYEIRAQEYFQQAAIRGHGPAQLQYGLLLINKTQDTGRIAQGYGWVKLALDKRVSPRGEEAEKIQRLIAQIEGAVSSDVLLAAVEEVRHSERK